MIRPTARTVVLAWLAVPVGAAIAWHQPDYWGLAFVVPALLVTAAIADLLLAPRRIECLLGVPAELHAGGSSSAEIALLVDHGWSRPEATVLLDVTGPLHPPPPLRMATAPSTKTFLPLNPRGRGRAGITGIWIRWTGPLGLVERTQREARDIVLPILPDLPAIAHARLDLTGLGRDAGAHRITAPGVGTVFEELVPWQRGMELRSIAWKNSARHGVLLAETFSTERDDLLVLAFDTSAGMAERVDGLPRLDHAVNAGLLLARGALAAGDRVALYSFDARPGIWLPPMAGLGNLPRLIDAAAALLPSHTAANPTLGLARLSGLLPRAALIVLFTDAGEATGAELLVENAVRLVRRHRIMFTVLGDPGLRELATAEPAVIGQLAASVVAGDLVEQRRHVLDVIARAGIEVIDVPAARLYATLVQRYVGAKQRGIG